MKTTTPYETYFSVFVKLRNSPTQSFKISFALLHLTEGSMENLDDDEGITMKTPRSRRFSDVKPKSVIEGGTEVGWTPLSSVILWKRMLGIMGNVNEIKDAEIHGCVFKHLIEIWLMLENVSLICIL